MFSLTQLQLKCFIAIEESIYVPPVCCIKNERSMRLIYSVGTQIKIKNLESPLHVAITLRKAKMIHRFTYDKKTDIVVMYKHNSIEVPVGRRMGRKDVESILNWEDIYLTPANVQHIAALFEFAECGKIIGIIQDTFTDFFLRA